MKLFHVCFSVDGQYHCHGLDYDNLDLARIWHLLCCSQVSYYYSHFLLFRIFLLSTLILKQRIELLRHTDEFSVQDQKNKKCNISSGMDSGFMV